MEPKPPIPGFVVALIAIVVAAVVLVIAVTVTREDEQPSIPFPPDGYEYCAQGDDRLTFCEKD